MPSPIAALDIGTTKTCALIGEVTDAGNVRILGSGIAPSRGVRKGVVTDVKETALAIVSAAEQAERVSGMAIGSVYVGIAGAHIQATNSRGIAAIHSGRGVTQDDIDRALEAAEAIAVPVNREIIHVIPRGFTLDGQDGVKDPLGMIGFRLEVEAHIVTGAAASIQNVTKAVESAGLKIVDLVLEPIAAGDAVLTPPKKRWAWRWWTLAAAQPTLRFSLMAVFGTRSFCRPAVGTSPTISPLVCARRSTRRKK
jgi:cell division protein FtsA